MKWFWHCCTFVFLTSCASLTEDRLPESSGRIDEVVVVIPGEEWNGAIGKELREYLGSEYPGLPQSEPRYDLRQVEPASFSGILQRASSILCVGNLSNQHNISAKVRELLDELEGTGKRANNMLTVSNAYAKPQQVIYLFGENENEIAGYIKTSHEKIIDRINVIENRKALNNMRAAGIDKGSTSLVNDLIGINLEIPASFRKVVESDSLIWFRQDVEAEVTNLIIGSFKMADEVALSDSLPIQLRDMWGKLVQGSQQSSVMKTEKKVAVVKDTLLLNNQLAVESRGLWRMSKDFVGGPFVNYLIPDVANGRLIMIDGFIYAPEYSKRRAVRKLENLIKTVKFPG